MVVLGENQSPGCFASTDKCKIQLIVSVTSCERCGTGGGLRLRVWLEGPPGRSKHGAFTKKDPVRRRLSFSADPVYVGSLLVLVSRAKNG